MFLKDWRERLDQFLQFHEREVLTDAGRVRREEADAKAQREFTAFDERRRLEAEEAGLLQLEDVGRQAAAVRREAGRAAKAGRAKVPRRAGARRKTP